MKNLFSKKWFKIALTAVALILVTVFIVVPYVESVKWNNEQAIEGAIRDIIEYPDLDDESIERAEKYMSRVMKSKRNIKKFDEQAVEAIKVFSISLSGSVSYKIDSLTEKQLMLEKLGYESPDLKKAFEEKIKETVELIQKANKFHEIPEYISDTEIDASSLTYYSDFKSVFINDLAPTHFKNQCDEAIAAGDVGEIMSLCNNLASMKEHLDFDANSVVPVDKIINFLTTDAEKIIVKEGEGGYYDAMENESSSYHKKDDAFSVVGDFVYSSLSTNTYYGDLKSYYYNRNESYSWDDEEGDRQHLSSSIGTVEVVYLRGEKISDSGINEKYIKHAYADDMTNYHKDGYCFAVSDSALVCYMDKTSFVFEF